MLIDRRLSGLAAICERCPQPILESRQKREALDTPPRVITGCGLLGIDLFAHARVFGLPLSDICIERLPIVSGKYSEYLSFVSSLLNLPSVHCRFIFVHVFHLAFVVISRSRKHE